MLFASSNYGADITLAATNALKSQDLVVQDEHFIGSLS